MNRHDEILTGVYHRGQERIWDGRQVFSDLLELHGKEINLTKDKKRSLKKIFQMILKGEEAAWKISLQLAAMLDNIPARLAATSQAHDEARHFYVIQNYLNLYDSSHVPLPISVDRALYMVMDTGDLAKKLLGMQLMVEPIALTIFQEIRRTEVEPILSGLLAYFERDEARHVALGVHHLPMVMKSMSSINLLSLTAWQFKLFMLELHGLRDLRADFENIGLSADKLFSLAERKQLAALEEVANELGWKPTMWKPLQNILRYQKKRILN